MFRDCILIATICSSCMVKKSGIFSIFCSLLQCDMFTINLKAIFCQTIGLIYIANLSLYKFDSLLIRFDVSIIPQFKKNVPVVRV